MSLLWDLPGDVALLVLERWLCSAQSLAALDAAVGGRCRSVWLMLLENMNVTTFPDELRLTAPSSLLQITEWKQARNLRMENITVNAAWLPTFRDHPEWRTDSVQKLVLTNAKEEQNGLVAMRDFYDLARRFPSATAIDAASWFQIDDDMLSVLVTLPISLHSLRLQTEREEFDYLYSDHSVSLLAMRFQASLTSLSLCCRNLTDQSLRAVALCGGLQHLSLCTFVQNLSPEAFHHCLRALTKLQALQLSDFEEGAEDYLEGIASAVPQVRTIEVRGARLLSQLEELVRDCQELRLVRARDLFLRLASPGHGDSLCPSLELFGEMDEGDIDFAMRSVPNLRRLACAGFVGPLSLSTVAGLEEQLASLRTLELPLCTIGPLSVASALAERCAGLEVLKACATPSAAHVDAFVRARASVREVAGCVEWSLAALLELLDGAPWLRCMHLCGSLQEADVEALRQRKPDVAILC